MIPGWIARLLSPGLECGSEHMGSNVARIQIDAGFGAGCAGEPFFIYHGGALRPVRPVAAQDGGKGADDAFEAVKGAWGRVLGGRGASSCQRR